MYGSTALDWIADILALTIPLPLLAFIFFYGTRPAFHTDGTFRWYRRKFSTLWMSTRIGQTLMYQKIAWLLYILFVIASLWLPNWHEGRPLVRFLIYTVLTVLTWEMFFGLRALQRSPVKDDLGVIRDDHTPADVKPFIPDALALPSSRDGLLVEHDTQPVPVIPAEQ